MQEKVLDDLAALIIQYGFEPIKQASYGNVGFISVQLPNEVGSLASVNYNFQTGTMNFSVTVDKRKVPSQPGRADYFDFYMDHDARAEYRNFRAVLEAELQALSKKYPKQDDTKSRGPM
jgi:hypothetical protein